MQFKTTLERDNEPCLNQMLVTCKAETAEDRLALLDTATAFYRWSMGKLIESDVDVIETCIVADPDVTIKMSYSVYLSDGSILAKTLICSEPGA